MLYDLSSHGNTLVDNSISVSYDDRTENCAQIPDSSPMTLSIEKSDVILQNRKLTDHLLTAIEDQSKVINDHRLNTNTVLSSVKVNSEHTSLCSSQDIALRYLVPEDIDNVKRLCKEIFPIEYPDYWYTEITSNQGLYALAAATWEKNEIVGLMVAEEKTLIHCNPEDRDILPKSLPANTLVSYILSLGVSRPYRCKGVASRLLDHYLQYLTCGVSPHSGMVKAVYLHVLCNNHEAIRFYQKRHFCKYTRLKDYYRINNTMMDGYTYVLYVNGGAPPRYLYDCVKIMAGILLYPVRRLFRLARQLLQFGSMALTNH